MSQVEYDVDQEDEEDEKETKYVAVEDEVDEGKPSGNVAEEDEDEEGDDDIDERLSGNRGDDDDDDDKKKSRREENKTRRVRQREARDRTARELNFLRTRNESLERRFSTLEQEVDARVTGSELSTVDSQINKAKSDMQLANQVIAQAADNNDGANLAEALNHRDIIRDTLRDLEQAKEYLNQERQPSPRQTPVDPRHTAHAQAFMRDHDWMDPRGGDRESDAVVTIDRSLVQEGYDPITKEYWDVLRERVREAIPDRFDTDGDDDDVDDPPSGKKGRKGTKQKRQEGPQFRTGGRERPLKKNEVYISPERKDAMIEAGIWDDPVARNSMLKRYAEYDVEAAQEKGR